MSRLLAGGLLIVVLSGCALQLAKSAMDHETVRNQVQLGDSQERVLALLEPIERDIPPMYKRAPDEFLIGKDRVLVYYARSALHQDGLVTDDEFTPYVFRNGVLVAKGWAALGGPRSHAAPMPPVLGLLSRGRTSRSSGTGAAGALSPLGPVTLNAYGPGVHMDGTGRALRFQDMGSGFSAPALGPITPNAYGPGVHMDATGRPMRLEPAW